MLVTMLFTFYIDYFCQLDLMSPYHEFGLALIKFHVLPYIQNSLDLILRFTVVILLHQISVQYHHFLLMKTPQCPQN